MSNLSDRVAKVLEFDAKSPRKSCENSTQKLLSALCECVRALERLVKSEPKDASGKFCKYNQNRFYQAEEVLAALEAEVGKIERSGEWGVKLKKDQVEWVVNDLAELGVKIGNQFFFLYKGQSYNGGTKWRYVGKREFGECCHPWYSIKKQSGVEQLPETYVGFYPEEHQPDFDNPWKDLP